MTISFDWNSYLNYRPFFDEILVRAKKDGHRVGVIASLREKEFVGSRIVNRREEIEKEVPIQLDFIHLWGETETISNASLWKCQKLDEEDCYFHFDPDATELKKYTDRWIFKTLDPTRLKLF